MGGLGVLWMNWEYYGSAIWVDWERCGWIVGVMGGSGAL